MSFVLSSEQSANTFINSATESACALTDEELNAIFDQAFHLIKEKEEEKLPGAVDQSLALKQHFDSVRKHEHFGRAAKFSKKWLSERIGVDTATVAERQAHEDAERINPRRDKAKIFSHFSTGRMQPQLFDSDDEDSMCEVAT